MSRSGYSDEIEDLWAWIRYRGAVNAATVGNRGQAFFRELVAALDAMPEKKLIAGELEVDGAFCALGVVGAKRGVDMTGIDTYDTKKLSQTFGIADSLAREVMYMNDEYGSTPEARWRSVRDWAAKQIKDTHP